MREISTSNLSAELQAAGYDLTLQEFHHDVTPLPNGHCLVLSNVLKPFTDLPGYPGVTNVLGDVVIDLDQNLQPAWVWNEFDHFDVNRHPMAFPDWTHTNAVIYSPSDGNIIVSMRHQNWGVKVDYQNGEGAGDVLWRLGEGATSLCKAASILPIGSMHSTIPRCSVPTAQAISHSALWIMVMTASFLRAWPAERAALPPVSTRPFPPSRSTRVQRQLPSPSIRFCPRPFIATLAEIPNCLQR